MPIRSARLIVVLLSLLACISLIGAIVFGVQAVERMAADEDRGISDGYSRVREALALKLASERELASVRGNLLTSDPAMRMQWRGATQDFDTALAAFEALRLDSHSQREVDRVRRLKGEYRLVAQQMMGLRENGASTESLTPMLRQGRDHADRILGCVDGLVAKEEAAIARAQLDLRQTSTRLKSDLLVLGGVSLPVLIGLSWLAIRRVVVPLAEMDRVARALGAGERPTRPLKSAVDEFGRVRGALRTMTHNLDDLTYQVHLKNDALELANQELHLADRHKDEFLAVISHELRTPLNFIYAYSSMLQEELEGPLNERQHMAIAGILEGSERLLHQIDKLLVYSRIQAGRIELVPRAADYQAVVDRVLSQLQPAADEKGIALKVDVRADGAVYLDEDRIGQVLTNLLENAIKFTPERGAVEVCAFTQGPDLLTEVRDTGIGLSHHDQPKLFRLFHQVDMSSTRTKGGTGIGLAIAKALVETHGGQIGVDSIKGRGSTFWFRIPDALVPLAA